MELMTVTATVPHAAWVVDGMAQGVLVTAMLPLAFPANGHDCSIEWSEPEAEPDPRPALKLVESGQSLRRRVAHVHVREQSCTCACSRAEATGPQASGRGPTSSD